MAYKDGDSRTINGVTYVRQNGMWLPQQSGVPNVLVPTPQKPEQPQFIPGAPGFTLGQGNTATPIRGLPPEQPKPTFIPGKDGYTLTPSGTAAPIPGLPAPGVQLDASTRAKALDAYNFARQLQNTVDELRTLYTAGPGETQGLEGLKDYLPTAQNKNFDAKANAARGIVGQVMGFTGGQLNTERESEKAVGPYLPQASDYDTTILQKIDQLQSLANEGRSKAIQTLGGEPDPNGTIRQVQPQTQQQASQPQDAVTLATGRTREIVDPTLKATGLRVGHMIASGVPDAQINDFLRQSGIDPASTNIDQALQFRKTPDFKRWQRDHTGQPYPLGSDFYTKKVPMSAARGLFNQTAATDLGGDTAAGVVAAGNALTGNRGAQIIGAINGDPAMAQTGMQLLRTNHPGASFAGDLAGQALLEASLGRIPGAQGLLATKLGRRGADALYGAYSGSGDTDTPGLGAVEGAASGLGFGMAGRGLQRGLGRVATGVQDANLGYLNNAGVPLTLGRIARGSDNDFGKTVGGIEDRLAGLPGFDAVIGDVRQQGDRAINREMFRQIHPSITKTGQEGLSQAYAAENAAYGKLAPVRMPLDNRLDSVLSAADQMSQNLRHHGGDVADVVKDIRDQISNGEITGKGYQSALQAIRKTRASLSDDVGGKASDALSALEQEVMDFGARQGGSVGQDLAAANALHGRIAIMQNALKSSVSQRAGEVVSPSTLNQSAINNVSKFGGIRKALSPERPFYDLTTAGMDVMPNATPDSGTAGRLAVLRALGSTGAALGGGVGVLAGDNSLQGAGEGGAIGGAGGLGLAALLMAPYSNVGRKAIQKALLAERPIAINRAGEFLLRSNPKFAGMFGSALGRDYFFQPELPAQ
jgi:hypothetical protein